MDPVTQTTPVLDARPRASARRQLTRMFLILLAITFVLRLPAFFVPVFNSDETFVATQAHVIEQGGELYEDAIDRKPPLVPYIYAATFAFFETSALWSVRVVAMLAVALTALLLAVEARRRYGERAGWIAGVLFVLAMVAFAPQDGQAANFEVFMLPSMTAAILFARRGRGVAAGVAIAFATLAKQTGAATLLPVLYLLARARQARDRAGRARVQHPGRDRRPARRAEPAPVLGGARQRLVPGREQRVGAGPRDVRAHDARLRRVQPPAPVEAAGRVARPP